MKLHLGAGNKRLDGYTSVDIRPETKPDIVANVDDLVMIKDDSVELIYACHILEHFSLENSHRVLEEWARVLVPQSGVLRLAVPDFQVIAMAYLTRGVHLVRLRGLLYGGQNYPENFHYATWDYETLAEQLRVCGFFNIGMWRPDAMLPRPPIYRDFSMMTINGCGCSLNVEAIAI